MFGFGRPRKRLSGAAKKSHRTKERKRTVRKMRGVGLTYAAYAGLRTSFDLGHHLGRRAQHEEEKKGYQAAFEHGLNTGHKRAQEGAKAAYTYGYRKGREHTENALRRGLPPDRNRYLDLRQRRRGYFE